MWCCGGRGGALLSPPRKGLPLPYLLHHPTPTHSPRPPHQHEPAVSLSIQEILLVRQECLLMKPRKRWLSWKPTVLTLSAAPSPARPPSRVSPHQAPCWSSILTVLLIFSAISRSDSMGARCRWVWRTWTPAGMSTWAQNAHHARTVRHAAEPLRDLNNPLGCSRHEGSRIVAVQAGDDLVRP